MEAFIGTPNWAAPETLTYPRRYSQQSDVFALALVTYECLMREELGTEFLKRHPPATRCWDFSDFTSSGGRPPLEELEATYGAGVCTVLATAWSQQPEERGTASELVDALCCSSRTVYMDNEVVDSVPTMGHDQPAGVMGV